MNRLFVAVISIPGRGSVVATVWARCKVDIEGYVHVQYGPEAKLLSVSGNPTGIPDEVLAASIPEAIQVLVGAGILAPLDGPAVPEPPKSWFTRFFRRCACKKK